MIPELPSVQPPKVVFWFKMYTGFLCLLYLALAAASLAFFLLDPKELEMEKEAAWLVGALLLGAGLVFFVICLLPLVLKPGPGVWTYDFIIICLGLTSACFWPACIPLLIFWLKPETKRYFRKAVP